MRRMCLVVLICGASCSAPETDVAFSFRGPGRVMPLSQATIEHTIHDAIGAQEVVERVDRVPAIGLAEELAAVITDQRAFYIRPDGDIVPSHELPAQERAAAFSRFGKLTPTLYVMQETLPADETLDVWIFVAGNYDIPEPPDAPVDGSSSAPDFEAWVTAQRELQRTRIEAANAALIADLPSDTVVLDTLSYVPLVKVRMTVADLQSDSLNTNPHVLRIVEDDDGVHALLGYAAQASMNMPSLVGGSCGASPCNGSGLPVGIWEHDPDFPSFYSAINTHNDALDHGSLGVSYLFLPQMCTTDADCPSTIENTVIKNKRKCTHSECVEEHLTYVAGSMGMIGDFDYDNDNTPNAPEMDQFASSGVWDVRYKVGNTNDPPGLDYILGASAAYINRSVDMVGPARLAAEFAGQYDGAFIVTAGGNDGFGVVSRCARFRNGLCVGGYYYEPYTATASHHCWTLSNDGNEAGFPERPHLLGPASHTNQSSGLALPDLESDGTRGMRYGDYNMGQEPQGLAIFGTSFASPAVMTAAMNAHGYEGWFSNLVHTQVTKAVILAGTVDSNLDGAIGLTTNWSTTLNAKDGAGHVDMIKVKATLDANQYFFRDMANSDFVSCGSGCREYVVASSVSIPSNKVIKVALVWNACSLADDGFTDAFLVNDLDLSVTKQCSGSSTTTTSNTITSELEMLEIACGVQKGGWSAAIKIRIKNGATLQACGTTTTERVGVAWSIR
jgi:hypothetical protein